MILIIGFSMKEFKEIIRKIEKKISFDEKLDLLAIDTYIMCLEMQIDNFQKVIEIAKLNTNKEGGLEILKKEMTKCLKKE